MISWKTRILLISVLSSVLMGPSTGIAAANNSRPEGVLRPSPATLEAHAKHSLNIPFYQAVPFARGELHPSDVPNHTSALRSRDGGVIPAVASPAALWPDGTVRWLAVEGVWPTYRSFDDDVRNRGVSVIMNDKPGGNEPEACDCGISHLSMPPVHSLEIRDDHIVLVNEDGEAVVTLTPYASYIDITEEKEILPLTVPDDVRQYAWAEALDKLNPEGTPIQLTPRVREHTIEQDNKLFTVYRVRGDGGASNPGNRLEWQMRVRIYRGTPVVRLQMTWGIHWHPDLYALTEAKWVAQFSDSLAEAKLPGAEITVDVRRGYAQVQSDPSGRGTAIYDGDSVAQSDRPLPQWNVWAAKFEPSSDASTDAISIGIGAPNANRLGPSHISMGNNELELASWSPHFGYGLDLRSTLGDHEFGIDRADTNTIAVGVTRSLETSLVWADTMEDAGALARLEARRDTLWLPTQADLVRTESLGPWSEETFEANKDRFGAIHANVYFMVASRDHWRWNGWANFGDIRTNYSTGNIPDRGLFVGRWALFGRYGWRNGSAQPFHGMWISALVNDDRDMALAAYDYALHVAEVDVSHASFFASPSPMSGGMHRRNKDHWSGSVQMQYTPSSALYLTQWLTGNERIKETLEEVRRYASRNVSGSAFAGSAWINRYMETHDPDDLNTARALLDSAARSWVGRSTVPGLQGLAALYGGNFRRTLDGFPVLIEFHQATDDPEYLEAMKTSIKAHGLPDAASLSLDEYQGIAYLLANGVSEEEIGTDIVHKAKEQVAGLLHPSNLPPRPLWHYSNLESFILTGLSPARSASYRESTNIGWRAEFAPLVFRFLGTDGEGD